MDALSDAGYSLDGFKGVQTTMKAGALPVWSETDTSGSDLGPLLIEHVERAESASRREARRRAG